MKSLANCENLRKFSLEAEKPFSEIGRQQAKYLVNHQLNRNDLRKILNKRMCNQIFLYWFYLRLYKAGKTSLKTTNYKNERIVCKLIGRA